jgi:hypothetical protein
VQVIAMDPRHLASMTGASSDPAQETSEFEEFEATELYCSRCRQAVPVRKRLLLVLPEGDKYEYICAFCAATVGSKIDRHTKPISILY